MSLSSHTVLWFAYLVSLYFLIFWFITFWENKERFKKEEERKLNLDNPPFVSVLIPAHNEESQIKDTINSVLKLNYPKDRYEIIVINDGSKDCTKDKIQEVINENKDRKIIVIDQENQGKADSLNNALKIAKGKFFACLDADSYVEQDTLMKMMVLYEKENDPDLAIITPAMKVKKPKNLLQKFQRIEYMTMMFMGRLMSHLNCIYVAPGPFSIYRTAIIKKLGGFDKKSLTEDQEIAYRAQKHNYKLRHCYNAYVYTSTPKKFRQLFKQRNRWYKGGIFNLIKYKNMIWNKKYGDFGIIQMTNNVAIFILGAATISCFSYYVIWPLLKTLYKFFLVGFNIWPYITSWSFTAIWLDINVPMVMILGLIFMISSTILYISYKNAREKLHIKHLPHIFLYFLVYYLFLCLIELVVFVELARGKKQKW